MLSLKTVFSIALQNIRKWQTDYRMWTIAALLIIMIMIFADDMSKVTAALDTEYPLIIFPFLYIHPYLKVIFTLPVVLMFCNAPFTDRNQTFVLMRTSRVKWLCGQILYIIIAAAVYYLFIFLVSIIVAFMYGGTSFEWGKTLNTAAYTNIADNVGAGYVEVPRIIVEYFKPLQACFFTFLNSWLSAILMGLTAFFCNLLSKSSSTGVIASAGWVVLAATIGETFGIGRLTKYSPISWITLDKIDIGKMTAMPSFSYCMCVYAGLIIGLIALIFIFGRKQNLDKGVYK